MSVAEILPKGVLLKIARALSNIQHPTPSPSGQESANSEPIQFDSAA